ncbi:hypothetical protein RDI58_013724 [Solanum bulbocastanum]|uniref:Protein kinase domain-containing protein n=1 Tax=Solanum bulbocastanum TaxID=147425 RepID=A0AAN8YE81_SOLBU
MDLQQKIAASLEYLAAYRLHYSPRKKLIPEFTYDPGLGKVFIDQHTVTMYVFLEIIGKYVQLRRTHNYNLLDVIYKACYYTSDWIHNDSLLPSGYATRVRQGFCVALPYMSEGSLSYILPTRFHNGLPEDCIAIALKQALLGLFDLHFSGLVHKRFSVGISTLISNRDLFQMSKSNWDLQQPFTIQSWNLLFLLITKQNLALTQLLPFYKKIPVDFRI